MTAQKVDVLVLGATGYTGKLTTEYLASHPKRDSFSLGIGGRSLQKLQQLSKQLSLSSDTLTFAFNITNYTEVETVVKNAKVIINCIGPFFKWSTPVVQACAKNGVHYVDITGEPWWIKDLIHDYDFEASKTKAIIIPASGNDSIPSDLTVYLSARELLKKNPKASIGRSVTGMAVEDAGLSGGTLHTVITGLEEVPKHKLEGIDSPDWLSPVHAINRPFRFSFNLPFTNIYGGMSPMATINEKIVYRTWGIFEGRALSTTSSHKDPQAVRYGPNFQYEECVQTRSRITGMLVTLALMTGIAAMTFLPPVRWFLKRFGPQPGSGPETREGARMVYTNVTSTDGPNPEHVKTVVTFKGAPYPMTGVLVAESALTILFDHDKLCELAQQGGILTSMSGLGDSLVKRLVDSGKIAYESKPLHPNDTRKTA